MYQLMSKRVKNPTTNPTTIPAAMLETGISSALQECQKLDSTLKGVLSVSGETGACCVGLARPLRWGRRLWTPEAGTDKRSCLAPSQWRS